MTTLFQLPCKQPRKRRSDQALFDLARKHHVKTMRSRTMPKDEAWLAVLPQEEDRERRIVDIMADSCRLYDDAGLIATGRTRAKAIQELLENNHIYL